MCVWPPRGAIPTLSPLSGWERQGGQLPGFYKLQFPAQRRDLGAPPPHLQHRGGEGGGSSTRAIVPGEVPTPNKTCLGGRKLGYGGG